MAKLKIGNGIKLQAELPKLDQSSPKIGPTVIEQEQPSGLDVLAMVEKAITALSRQEPKKDVDLERLNTLVNDHVFMLIEHQEKLEALESVPKIEIPEVKHITNVRDVSKEVMEVVEDNKRQLKADLMCHANHIVVIESKLKTQKVINCVLSGVLVLTIFLHLL